jgi:hypothetical protein
MSLGYEAAIQTAWVGVESRDSAIDRLLLIPAPNGIIWTSCVRTTNIMRIFFRAWLVCWYDLIFSIGGEAVSSAAPWSEVSGLYTMVSKLV